MSPRGFEVLGKMVGLSMGAALLLIAGLYAAEHYGPASSKGRPRVVDRWVYHPMASIFGVTERDMAKARENVFGRRICIDGSSAPDEWSRKVRDQRITREREKLFAGGNEKLMLTPPTFTFPKK